MEQRTNEKISISEMIRVDHKNLAWARNIIYRLTENNFYGTITLSLKNGKIISVREEKTLIPPE